MSDGLYPPSEVVAAFMAATAAAAEKQPAEAVAEAPSVVVPKRGAGIFGRGQHGKAPIEETPKRPVKVKAVLQPPSGFARAVKFESAQVCDGPVWALACNDNGLVATGGADSMVCIRQLDGELMRLDGHDAAVYGLAWQSEVELVSVSADATARLWQLPSGDCAMVFQHGGPVCAVCSFDADTFVTGGFDRTLRIWNVPLQRATCWAHVNDAVTAVALQPLKTNGKASLAVGLRGGQIFAYTALGTEKLEFEEMYLSTMRSGAFLEAERCGASGAAAPTTEDEFNFDEAFAQSVVPEISSNKKTRFRSIRKGASKMRKSLSRAAAKASTSAMNRLRAPDAVTQHGEQQAARQRAQEQRDEVKNEDDELFMDALSPEHLINKPAYLASLESVRHRVNSLEFVGYDYEDEGAETVCLDLLACCNSACPRIYNAMKPEKAPTYELLGGQRVALGCSTSVSACGKFAVGGSEDGKLYVWRLANANAEPAVLDAAMHNALIRAVTVARFCSAQAATALLGGNIDLPEPHSAVIAATDYSGRLLLFKREDVAGGDIDFDALVKPLNAMTTPSNSLRPGRASPSPFGNTPLAAPTPSFDDDGDTDDAGPRTSTLGPFMSPPSEISPTEAEEVSPAPTVRQLPVA